MSGCRESNQSTGVSPSITTPRRSLTYSYVSADLPTVVTSSSDARSVSPEHLMFRVTLSSPPVTAEMPLSDSSESEFISSPGRAPLRRRLSTVRRMGPILNTEQYRSPHQVVGPTSSTSGTEFEPATLWPTLPINISDSTSNIDEDLRPSEGSSSPPPYVPIFRFTSSGELQEPESPEWRIPYSQTSDMSMIQPSDGSTGTMESRSSSLTTSDRMESEVTFCFDCWTYIPCRCQLREISSPGFQTASSLRPMRNPPGESNGNASRSYAEYVQSSILRDPSILTTPRNLNQSEGSWGYLYEGELSDDSWDDQSEDERKELE